jgi:DUF1365 family protein
VSNDFTYRTWLWFVDLDDPPRLPLLRPLGQLRARDHAGDPRASLRANVDAFLAEEGVDLRGGRVTMLTAARSLGHVFNPLTVYWCHDAAGDLVRVIAEVHNTYGGTAPLPARSRRGRACRDGEGVLRLAVLPGGRHLPALAARAGRAARVDDPVRSAGRRAPFVAVLRGGRRPLTTRGLLRQAARQPSPTLLTAARIRRQGVRLYLRGLPVIPRSRANPRTANPQEGRGTPMTRTEATTSTDKRVAGRIEKVYRELTGAGLPVGLRAWDGSERRADGEAGDQARFARRVCAGCCGRRVSSGSRRRT